MIDRPIIHEIKLK